jgi:Na+/H+ antiporter NhaD/arsenite permease-like protein
MTTDQIILFALFGSVFGLLLWGRFRCDIVAFSALMAGVVLGVVDSKDAFDGFGHPATLVVALVLVVSAGLVRSGAVLLITRTLIDSSRSLGAHITLMGAVGGILSAFMNNVAALALLMPVDIQTARKAGRSPGLSLMPLSFATILGGMVTLIGTPPQHHHRRHPRGKPWRAVHDVRLCPCWWRRRHCWFDIRRTCRLAPYSGP